MIVGQEIGETFPFPVKIIPFLVFKTSFEAKFKNNMLEMSGVTWLDLVRLKLFQSPAKVHVKVCVGRG